MKVRNLILMAAAAAAVTSMHAYAGEHRKPAKPHRVHWSMHTVAVHAKAGQPAHGWRYFSDARAGRAVVISPRGEYFYSEGDGLKLVYQAT